MKRDRNFYYFFVMICFVVVYIASFVLMNRNIEAGQLIATAGVVIYPMTYFLATLFAERYGKDRLFNLFTYAVVSLVFIALLFLTASVLPVYHFSDGLEKIFSVDFRLLFSFVAASLIGQFFNYSIYYFLDKKRSFNFLISSVIAITIDSLIFVTLAYVGTVSWTELLQLFSGQYVLSVMAMIIYALCFAYLINTVVATKRKNSDMEKLVLERTESLKAVKTTKDTKEAIKESPVVVSKPTIVKKTPEKKVALKKTVKKATTKTETTKKPVKKTTTKKETTKKRTTSTK